MLGMSDNADVIHRSADNVREALGADGILRTRYKKSSFSHYSTAYVDVALEVYHKRKYALECDLAFWAARFLTLAVR